MDDSQLPLFDVSALNTLWELEDENEPNLVESLVADFDENSTVLLLDIQKSFAARDARNLEIAAHSLKSSARLLGCLRLEQACYRLEERSRDGQLDSCEEILGHLPALIAESLRELNANWAKWKIG